LAQEPDYSIYRQEDAEIVEDGDNSDDLGLEQQLGLIA